MFRTMINHWLFWVGVTVLCWGVYGVLLHTGSMEMKDPRNGRFMSFLLVGVAYFLVAVVAPVVVLKMQGGRIDFWNYPGAGFRWSLVAGIAGAVGAFGVLMAFRGAPDPKASYVPVVMSIIFAGAPVVNAITAMTHRPPNGWAPVDPRFVLGIALAAAGGCLVSLYKPKENPPPKPAAAMHQPVAPGYFDVTTRTYPIS